MSSANFSSDEESISPSRHKGKEKKMGQKNSILDYFRKSDKPNPEPQPETSSSSAGVGSPKKAEKVSPWEKKKEVKNGNVITTLNWKGVITQRKKFTLWNLEPSCNVNVALIS